MGKVRLHHAGVRCVRVGWDLNSPWPRARFDFMAPLAAGDRIPFPCAGAVMVHRDCLADLGGWDTGFFLDFEDMDLGLRAWQRGWHAVTVPEAKVFHAVGASDPQALTAARDPVSRRRYVSNRSSLAVMALKTFSFSALPLTAVAWWSAVLEVLRRAPSAWRFRRANAALNRRRPGERFFSAPEFTAVRGDGR